MSRTGTTETKNRFAVARRGLDGVREIWKPKLIHMEFLFWGDENVLRLFVVMIAHICEHTKKIDELYTLRG